MTRPVDLRDDSSAALADPAPEAPASGTRRPWRFWASPAGQPRWARPALLGIAALAALLYAWHITSSGYAPFYSVAARSMSESWKAFLYGALDPGATITIDKIGGFLWPQALSARVFGFHAWSLTLPQVIEGVVTVLVSYRVVRRWSGELPGLLAAAMMALTPVAVSMFGHAMEDGSLTMCLVLAADAYQRAVLSARLRPLLAAGVWVGLGFQAKMLEAWVILPALAIAYLVVAPAPLRRRLGQLLVAGIVTAAVSLSWVLLVTLTPAADRPYVDGSTNNSAFSMVFGYNGFNRFSGGLVEGAVSQMGGGRGERPGGFADRRTAGGSGGFSGLPGFPGAGGTSGTAGGQAAPGGAAPGAGSPGQGFGGQGFGGQGFGGRGFGAGGTGGGQAAVAAARPGGGAGAQSGATKLVSSRFAPEIGWLYPLAVLSLVLGLWWRRRAARTDQIRGGFLMWGLWLGTAAVVLSSISVPHTAYVELLAPPIAALSATGLVMFWQVHRAGGRRAWVLPLAVAAEVAWGVYLSSSYPDFLPWLTPVLILVGAGACVALGAARLSGAYRRRLALGGLAAALVAVLVAPAAWSLSALDPRYDGSAIDASAGPTGAFGGFGGAARRTTAELPAGAAERFAEYAGRAGRAGGGAFGSDGTLTAAQRRLLAYTEAHRDGAAFVFAADSDNAAEPYILATGATVMPMGGFSGSVPTPTLAQVRKLVAAGRLHYVLLSGQGGFSRGGSGTALEAVRSWVRSSCTAVPATAYGGTESAAAGGSAGTDAAGGTGTLYHCTA
jgi:4-amino-4-deoxy-L-arabinose transferase-like glycosyltransferase